MRSACAGATSVRLALSLALLSCHRGGPRCAGQPGERVVENLPGPAVETSLMDGQPKKGVGLWYSPSAQTALLASSVSWYYDWSVDQRQTVVPPPGGVEYVPMAWGMADVTDDSLAQAQALGTTLLGFNEPDNPDQSNITVEQALALWPRLIATGMRQGSPAAFFSQTADGSGNAPQLPFTWLERFVSGARERAYRVDFVCLHWYGGNAATWASGDAVLELRDFLEAAHERLKLPIWLTEFALVDWGVESGQSGPKAVHRSTPTAAAFPTWEQHAAFIRSATRMMDALPFVERYAWFSLGSLPQTSTLRDTLHLYDEDGKATPAGVAYRGTA